MSTAEQLDETWDDDTQEIWRQVFDAACKEAGWEPVWSKDPEHGWTASNYEDSPLTDQQVLTAVNIGRRAVGFRPLTYEEFHRT